VAGVIVGTMVHYVRGGGCKCHPAVVTGVGPTTERVWLEVFGVDWSERYCGGVPYDREDRAPSWHRMSDCGPRAVIRDGSTAVGPITIRASLYDGGHDCSDIGQVCANGCGRVDAGPCPRAMEGALRRLLVVWDCGAKENQQQELGLVRWLLDRA